MREQFILVLDEGTTSTRAMIFAPDGAIVGKCQAELTQYYPAPGWVEHDAIEIRDRTIACARQMIERAGGADRIAAIGIANQRETIVAWDRSTGQPVSRAIVWQDRRTAARCDALRDAGHEPLVSRRSGLVLDPYFSATKISWILDNVPEARALGDRLAVGTVESWLLWSLTGGLHASDASNASRTMLMDIAKGQWDDELLALHDVPRLALPEIVDCAGNFGVTSPELFGSPIRICGLVGDQQAAAIGQSCLAPGQVKATLGTGAFILCNTGAQPVASGHRLLGTVLFQLDGERSYALEGSIFVAGSVVQWLRDRLGIIASAAETETLARSVRDSGGVMIIPALSGLGAPHWRPDARAIVAGLSHGSGRAEIVRAALESIAHQLSDLQRAYAGDGCVWQSLRIDGGMSANNWIAQDIADMLDVTVQRPDNVETTALGAAMLAAMGCGLMSSLDEAASMQRSAASFTPGMENNVRKARMDGWRSLMAVHAASSS
ncbi:glycerol kinase GlpK [Sphingomonas cavernae]|uniref:Glycerol kinase n=1 Tax=Sphingomonas cavernae TaxID=2320861 RepID=A0A418WKN0_9SPHN|nr:glycerol kinase GlpK [Sphingomonas cavernae]RJF90594.1 glycerol kinase [Sphingomonas cavernae]